MPMQRLSEMVSDTMTRVWMERAQPDDDVVYETALTAVQDEDGHAEVAVIVYAAMACPEAGEGRRCTAFAVIPSRRVYSPQFLERRANEFWDRLVAQRIEASLGPMPDVLDGPV